VRACAVGKSNLSEADVRALIKGTADKVGPYPYDENRNDFFGSGRLNVREAVRAATAKGSGGGAYSKPVA